MKICINYDLISKIHKVNGEFSLQRISKYTLLLTSIPTVSVILNHPEIIKYFFKIFGTTALMGLPFSLMLERLLFVINGEKDINKLKLLSSQLKSIDVNTNYELLLNSYKYKIEYEFNKDENKYKLIEKKYIMVPVDNNENEISILQEHIIGNKQYFISCGSPNKTKVLKPILNSI